MLGGVLYELPITIVSKSAAEQVIRADNTRISLSLAACNDKDLLKSAGSEYKVILLSFLHS
jgi:hypothetical protein